MTSPSPPAASSPTRHSTRSPTTSMNMSTANTTSTTPSKIHHHGHHPHLPVGHATHSPAQSASGEAIQGRPSEAGGLHTSTSRGNILLPPSSMSASSSIPSTPADLLSVISSTTSGHTPSRPHSPSAPNSPVLLRSASSRPTSPRPSNHQDLDLNTTPQLDSSAVFERDVEFANDHLLTGSEAIDLAAAPVLSEVALSVTSNEPSSLESSGIIGGGHSGQASPFNNITQSLDSTLFSNTSPATGLPSNAIVDGQQVVYHNIPLSEQLRQQTSSGARATSEGTGEFSSPPPSLSLSPSDATGSPRSSSTPGSPIQSVNHSSSLVSPTAGNNQINTSGTAGSLFAHHISDGGAPVSGLDIGDGASAGIGYASGKIVPGMPSPPGSAMSGISLSGGQNDQSKRRLSMISYADIINSERLSDSHSGFSSPTPSSAMSLSAAALPVHTSQGSNRSPALSPALSPGLAGIGAAGTGPVGGDGGTGSALYSPVTSPEGEGALSPSITSEGGPTRETSSVDDGLHTTSSSSPTLPSLSKPANNRTETMSSVATERYHMPGQLPVYTPPITQSNETEDKDVTPTNSSIRKDFESGNKNEEGGELKESTSSSSWNMLELGKSLVGSAAGAVGSVLGVAGIGTEIDEDDTTTDDRNNRNGL